jgi:hypothetical protein
MDKIISKRLKMTLSNNKELNELENIEKECKANFSFEPRNERNPDWSVYCILEKDIPVNSKEDNYYFYCIRHKNKIIGFLDYCLEYMDKEILHILYNIYFRKVQEKWFWSRSNRRTGKMSVT